MTHMPETGAINELWCQFLAYLSSISGGFIWYQILASIIAQLNSKLKTGMHVTELMIYDWSLVIVYFFISC